MTGPLVHPDRTQVPASSSGRRIDAAARLARTVRHLRPQQVAHRLRLQAQRKVVQRLPELAARRWMVTPSGPVGLPVGFTAIDAVLLADRWRVIDLSRGTFTFINERRDLGDPIRWDPPGATQLWLFHHHYWEWAWSLAAHHDRSAAREVFATQWRSWKEGTAFGRWNAWAAYPTSLRAWVLVNVFDQLVAGSELEPTMVHDLGLHAGFIEHNLELDVGGNHTVKNLKALVGLAVFLDDEPMLRRAGKFLRREIDVQVLDDGGHYELSPSYHCQVLADLIDIAGLLEAGERDPFTGLDAAIDAMRAWLGVMLMPDGDVPLLNDCEPVSPELLRLLRPGPGPAEGLTVLPHSGHAVVRRGPFHLVADVGQPGPTDLPGHIHADCLSFELAVDGDRLVVDPGTSEYGSGPRRQYERSTRAHNTVEVDGTDQTEVWGAFRAGRRARATLEHARDADGTVTVTASHDGYRHLPGAPVHRRTWTVDHRTLHVTDTVTGAGTHRIASRLTVPMTAVATDRATDRGTDTGTGRPVRDDAPHRAGATPAADRTVREPRLRGVDLHGPHLAEADATDKPLPSSPTLVGPTPTWHRSDHARGFGALAPALTVELDVTRSLPVRTTFAIEHRPPAAAEPDRDRR